MKKRVLFGIILIIALVFAGIFFFRTAGHVSLDIQEQYGLNEKLSGTISLAIEPGDLIKNSTGIELKLEKEGSVVAEKTFPISEFMQIEPVEIYETKENCSEILNEENITETICENITLSDFYFNQTGTYTRNIQDFLKYTFSEAGDYKLAFLIPSLNLVKEKVFSVAGNIGYSGNFTTKGFGVFAQANASGNVVFQCGTLDSPGDYTMNQSITNNSLTGACINITSQNITLDCVSYANYILSDDEVEGIYSNQRNTTIRNCNITMASTKNVLGGYAISLTGAHSSFVYNNTVTGKWTGISLSSTQNSSIYNNTIINNYIAATGGTGIALSSSSSNNITTNSFSGNNYGLSFTSSNNNNIIGNNFNQDVERSIFLDAGSQTSTGNYFENNNLYNCSTCVYMSRVNGQTFSGGVMSNSTSLYVYLLGSSNNTFKNINFTGQSSTNEILLQESSGNALNNTFINCSYNISKESVAVGSQLIRKWYLDVNATDGNLAALSSANVSAYNVSGNLYLSALTGSNGLTSQQQVIEYINNATRIYYTNYTINATKSGFVTNSTSRNITDNLNLQLTLRDNTAPVVNLTSPANGADYSGASYSVSFLFNATDGGNIANCSAYANGARYGNTSAITSTANAMSISLSAGSYASYVNCTDTGGNTGNSSSVSFTITAPSASSSSGGGSTTIKLGKTYTYTESQILQGVNENLAVNDIIKFTAVIGSGNVSEEHTIKVSELKEKEEVVTLIISSSPITINLKIGEEAKIDLNKDGVYDLLVKFDSIIGGKARITSRVISEKIPQIEQEIIGENESVKLPDTEKPAAGKSYSFVFLVVGLTFIIVLIAGIIIISIRRVVRIKKIISTGRSN